MSTAIAGAAIAFVVVAVLLILGALLYLGWWLRGFMTKLTAAPVYTARTPGTFKLRAVGDYQ